ncbi:histone deacetylase [Marinicella sp. W31]|uniref:histone deacetylase family protein n=1 Tax=Marinicella sp. W31 TaxID=3023713 RepID=UPI003756B492
MTIPLVYSPLYSYTFPADHRFPMDKFRYLKSYLDAIGLTTHNNVFRPGRSREEVLHMTHCSDYVQRFMHNQLSKKELRRMGLPWSEGLVRRSLVSPNGTLLTASIALSYGVACHLAGGTHHAHYDHGRGYCVLNDLAVAANAILHKGLVQRILIFDCDVHQGDGTASILANEDRVFTCSIHCEKNFPHHKAESNLDVGLERGLDDEAYLQIVAKTLEEALQRCQPDLVLYDAGVDVFSGDGLGFLNISESGIKRRERLVLNRLQALNIPVATVIGGGYDRDQKALARRHAMVIEQAAAVFKAL